MRINMFKAVIKAVARVACIFPLAAVAAFGQQQVNLTAGPATATLPDGSTVPMWGYSCGAAVSGSTASCAALNPAQTNPNGWSPVIITVPTGQDLTVNLTNNLSFSGNGVPTSLVIVGQLGGGLGTTATATTSPDHSNAQANVTWPIAGAAGNPGTPPMQGPRVQSFSTEVAAGITTSLTWKAPRAGTYLIESGTHPSIQGPMGLYGILVVTSAPSGSVAGTAYPNVKYNAEVPLLLSEIDPVQNNAVQNVVNSAGFSESATIGPNLNVPVVSVTVTSGGAGYTVAPNVSLSGGGGSGATATANIDTTAGSPTYGQVIGIDVTNGGTGYSTAPKVTIDGSATATAALGLTANAQAYCSGGAKACYPPVVNYTPLYYLFNGVAFNRASASASLFPAVPAVTAGNVLVRFVNAGLRMHVPSIVGAVTGNPAAGGFSLIAEDGNVLPGIPRVQSEVFMAAGKTYDVMIDAPAACTPVAPATTCTNAAMPVFDRQLSLSGNAIARDAGMLAYIGINGAGLPAAPVFSSGATATDDAYTVVPGKTLTVSDPSKGLIANDINVYGVQVYTTAPTHGNLALNADGTFTYIPDGSWSSGTTQDTFTYQANGGVPANGGKLTATVTLTACAVISGCSENPNAITVTDITYNSNVATFLNVKAPGVLSVDKDSKGYPLTVVPSSVMPSAGLNLIMDSNGGFNASVSASGTYTFTYQAQNSQGTVSTNTATVTLIFPAGSNLAVSVVDGKTNQPITDYRWIIEEDRTFYIDPTKTTNTGSSIVPTFGTNFHTSYMPVVATGCTGTLSCESGQSVLGQPAVCDLGNGACRTTASQQTPVDPSQVLLDPYKRYYISVLPGDAAFPFETANATPGHGMGGAPIAAGATAVTVLAQPTPFPPAKLSVFVFEDDFPLNGEQDAGGGVDVLAPNEPGLGGFNITIFDDAGGPGDPTGQVNYDMFNQPLSNSLAGTIDPASGFDACPISAISRIGTVPDPANPGQTIPDVTQTGITGMIVTCPKFEADGKTLSPLAGQAVIANMMPGRYGVVATPGADRIGRGEEWLQTNTLDGQKAHDSFLRIGEPSFFQEYGPAGYHVTIGFANPAIINGRLQGICNNKDINLTGSNCANSITGMITTERMSRTPDERLYSSGSRSSFAFTQCYVSVGDPDGEDFAFTKCNADGTFTIGGLPDGDWRVTTFDQWNDQLVDGLSTPVRLAGGKLVNMGDIAANQWQANFNTRTFLDLNGDGISQSTEPGLALVKTNVRFRDGSFSNRNNTDLNGYAAFNEEFPLFSWYVLETDVTRYKNTGTHVVYDAGGPADGTTCGSPYPACGTSTIADHLANTVEQFPLPTNLRVPGAVYCDNADCNGFSVANGPGGPGGSTGRIDPPWVLTEGWQGFSGQNNFLEFGKKPYAVGENGGIRGHVIYSSTRPFDDPQFGTQNVWEPLVPGVTINLYQEGTAPDGSNSLTLVDTTKTSSWDEWAQGFRSDGVPNMNCPGQSASDPFYFSLYNQPMFLDVYNHNGTAANTIPNNSQFKCYDGMHNWNQLQPAPYDGMYQFPSVTGLDPVSGKPTGTNCTICATNPDTSDPYRHGLPMLPKGKYVVEVVVPPGYELVKEEDKNILIGDNFIAPVTVQFPGLGSAIYIIPDQASVSSTYNPNSAQNPTQSLGRIQSLTSHEGDTPTVDTFWPCVGETRIVPDYISLFPGSNEVAPFAGATRNLCDRKEVTLDDQTSSQAEFFVFTSTHAAAHFTGVITDDFTSEFDPFSPQFGEKFSPANLPISIKDWAGNEISRVYTDHWGSYNGLTYSTWEVNPPNPTGYSPTMMVTCMNDPGTGAIPDPLFNPSYSQFCYEIPFMPGATQYMDTPVVPTAGFVSAGYNNPDCAYPDATPAVKEVDGDGVGPYVSAAGNTLTIQALGDVSVNNNAYSGPSATTAPYNQKTGTRHYGFGTQCTTPTASSPTCNTASSVTIGGVNAPITSGGWADGQITVTVPAGVPLCAVQQQRQYRGTSGKASCGELVITAGNGKQSIDAVTVTIGGKAPTHVTSGTTIQSAIDAADPGDLIIVNPGVYQELLLMWKPVRLQGVGAASTVINANTHPAGKLTPWRAQVNCLFGLALNGQPYTSGNNPVVTSTNTNPFDSTGASSCPGKNWKDFTGGPNNPQVDRLPLEGILGWDTTVNGNLAQLLQEPTLMGAYEGAGITVLGKGVKIPAGATNIFGSGAESAFPTGSTVLTEEDCDRGSTKLSYSSNFQCNPSSIDGLSVTNASQGGGGIFVHAWGHNLQIANNRVYNNAGTLTGGITIGQGESPDAYLVGATASDPGSCLPSVGLPNTQLPYCFNIDVNIHHNAVTLNSSIGDELFSSTPAGAGGVTLCTGADYYKFNYNWVCGNLSTGDGGGVTHLGFIWNGTIEHNKIMFNQSTNPTVPTNGGGLIVMGAPPDGAPIGSAPGTECGSTAADADCTPGLSDGTGPNLLINANLFKGNAAESGSGGGIRLQNINGTEVTLFPMRPKQWNSVKITNNIIVNNVAGWDGAGVSLEDALAVNLINNTIVSNDTTASAGPLFNTLGAPLASSTGPTCTANCGTTTAPQPAGLVTMQNTPQLTAALPNRVMCPDGHGDTLNGPCRNYSVPLLYNDVFWQNRSFYIGVGNAGAGTLSQQNIVSLYNAFTGTQAATQPQADAAMSVGNGVVITGGTGACVLSGSGAPSFWDIGVRGDLGPGNHTSGLTLAPHYSVLTNTSEAGNGSNNLLAMNPTFVSQYCNGSRVPPEQGSMGYQVPPGISDATVPNPVFNLTPAATVDEGNNWVNMSWGPLAETHPLTGATLGNYALAVSSPAIDYIPVNSAAGLLAPNADFFGNPRPDPSQPKGFDVGAVEFQGANPVPTLSSISPNFGARGRTVAVTLTGTNLIATTAITVSGTGVSAPSYTVVNSTTITTNFIITSTAGLGTVNVHVTAGGNVSNDVPFTVQGPTLTSISPASGVRGTSVNVTLTGSNLLGATGVNAQGNNISVSNFVVVNATTVTATLTLASGTALGGHNISVSTPNANGGVTNSVTFTVLGGTASFTIPPGMLTTGSGTATKNGTITVTNTATGANAGALTLTAAPTIARQTGTGTFTITGGTCVSGTVIAPSGGCTINVRYVPPTTGPLASTANVTIADTGATTATQTSTNFTGN